MPAKLLVTGLVTAFNLGLALLVYLKDPSRWINRAFGVFALTVAGWTLGTYLGSTYAGTPTGLLVGRGAFAMAGLTVYALLVFLHIFPEGSMPRRSYTVTLFGILAATLALIAVTTPWIVATQTIESGTVKVQYGLLYPFFALYIFGSVGYSFFTILRKVRLARGVGRLQLKYLFLGLLVPVVLATITNLLIPLAFGTSQFSHYGPLFSLLMIAMIAHAIVRQRLMNIRLVIRRGVVLLLAVAIAGSIFVGLLGLITTFVLPRHRELPLSVQVGLVLLIAILFQPLRQRIQTSLDRYLYREPYDYQRTIRGASRTIGSMLDLKSLLSYICEVIGRTVRPEAVSVYMRSPERPGYTQMAIQRSIDDNNPQFKETLPESSLLIRFLASVPTYLLRDDLRRTEARAGRNEALKELVDLGGEIALPILHEDQLTGFLIVAPKLSGDPYFTEDIDLLSILVSQAAIAIKNAQLYREVAVVNEYITNIVATMESGVIAVDPDSKVTLFNPAAERITGLAAREIRSGPAACLPSALAHSLQATLTDGQPRVQTETTIPDASGHYWPVSSSTYALRDRLGNILGAVAIFSDLTRLKELEGEKRRAERLASIGALAGGIAHEIKNPLVAIKTFAELLPERFTEKDFREDFSQVVIREIARIDDLVARLRGLAAPAARPLPSLDLRSPIEETLVLLRAQLEQKRIGVRRLYERALPQVAGDPAQLKQLFLNLFMNALEAMEPGGELTIQLARAESMGASSLVAKVSDTGSGIPEGIVGKVFDPFVTTKPRGSGLGLAICRGIADAHRATIRMENNINCRGTTATIEFAVTEESPAVIRT